MKKVRLRCKNLETRVLLLSRSTTQKPWPMVKKMKK